MRCSCIGPVYVINLIGRKFQWFFLFCCCTVAVNILLLLCKHADNVAWNWQYSKEECLYLAALALLAVHAAFAAYEYFWCYNLCSTCAVSCRLMFALLLLPAVRLLRHEISLENIILFFSYFKQALSRYVIWQCCQSVCNWQTSHVNGWNLNLEICIYTSGLR